MKIRAVCGFIAPVRVFVMLATTLGLWACTSSVPGGGVASTSTASNDFESRFCAKTSGPDCPATTDGLVVPVGTRSTYLTFVANSLINNAATVTSSSCTVNNNSSQAIANCTMATYALALPNGGVVTHPFAFDRSMQAGAYTIELVTSDKMISWPLLVK